MILPSAMVQLQATVHTFDHVRRPCRWIHYLMPSFLLLQHFLSKQIGGAGYQLRSSCGNPKLSEVDDNLPIQLSCQFRWALTWISFLFRLDRMLYVFVSHSVLLSMASRQKTMAGLGSQSLPGYLGTNSVSRSPLLESLAATPALQKS